MEPSELQALETELLTQALAPLATAWQNTWLVREPAERFASLGYLHEVILKCLVAKAFGRVRTLGLVTPELTTYLRDAFRQPSTGHWAGLFSLCQRSLGAAGDRWSRSLDGLMRKKLRDEPILQLDQRVNELLGHTISNRQYVTLAALFESLIELRNKTRGHGAPRRVFFEDINPLLEASLLTAIQTLRRYLWGDLVYLEDMPAEDNDLALQGQALSGVMRRPWQGVVSRRPWFQPNRLYWLESTEDSSTLHPFDPLVAWDHRSESVGFYNGYVASKQQIEYLSYARGAPWHDRSRSYEQAFALPLQSAEAGSEEPMKTFKIWSNKGVALYPVDFPLVGQNAVFNGLFKFKQSFLGSQANDIAGFFALIGDWGLGKTRIGYELFAQTIEPMHRWLLNTDEFIVPNGTDGRLLKPQLADGVLPLYVRYGTVCDGDLFAENWIAKTTATALAAVAKPSSVPDAPQALVEDIRAVLTAKGVDLAVLAAALETPDDDARLRAAMDVLRPAGVDHLWVVVDEVETQGDLKKGLRDDEHESIAEDYLDMVSVVIKHENYRQTHPYIGFLVLCSAGMRDKIEIGPNRRRTDSLELEPNRIGDVHTYVDSLRERAESYGQAVDYPAGTLEGAFIACNRNFGWFNVMMSSIHESYRQARAGQRSVNAWQLIEEFARTEPRAKWIFDTSVLDLLRGIHGTSDDIVKRLIFGQVPMALDGLDSANTDQVRGVEVPGMGRAFVELAEVHLDASTLAAELVRPEIGFRLHPRGGDWYIYYNSEISIGSLLAALRAFSMGVSEGNFLVCRDLAAFTAQLSALYERPGVDTAQIAEPLHAVFMRYEEQGRQYLGPSFAFLQRLDVLLKREAVSAAFLQDPRKDAELERFAQEIEKSQSKRRMAICQGFARLLDESIAADQAAASAIQSGGGISFTSLFQSPRFEGLQVTVDGRVTVAYSRDLEKLAHELGDMLSQIGVHPMIVLLPAGYTFEDWTRLSLPPRVRLCAIPRSLTKVEEAFLIKLSGRGTIFRQPQDILSARTQSTRGVMVQNWQRDTREWREAIDRAGYLVRPIWHSSNVSEAAFARGYRIMLVKDWNIDQLAPDVNQGMDHTAYDQVKKACQYNADFPPGKEPTLEIISRAEPYRPLVPPTFGALLSELSSQTSLEALQRRFFFAGADRRNAGKHLGQALELLRELGLVTLSKSTYRAVNGQTIKDYRQATSTWLNGECQTLLADLADAFTPETVQRLKKQSASFAPKELEKVEEIAAKVDFSVLEQGGAAPPSAIAALARQIDEMERLLQGISPPGIYQQTGVIFEMTVDQISSREQQLPTASLWEQMHFYHWLRSQYRQRREQLAHAVTDQLAQTTGLETIDGHPFPAAPLTLPLKAIQEELNASLAMGGLSSRSALRAPGYPESVNTYLFMGQYASAWQRLEALGKFVERTQPTSFWARYQATRTQWGQHLQSYQHATTSWGALSQFVGEAASPAWASARPIKAKLEQFRALVDGGLVQAVNAEADHGAEKLIDTLEEEVRAAGKYRDLPQQIGDLRQAVEDELQALIDRKRLQALTQVLTARRRSRPAVPSIGKTYSDTKSAYEAFNVQVAEMGRQQFEGAGRQTTWEQWQEIYELLLDEKYVMKPEDDVALRELEEMKLVRRTVRLWT